MVAVDIYGWYDFMDGLIDLLPLVRMDMFFHICSVEREIYWQLGKFSLFFSS